MLLTPWANREAVIRLENAPCCNMATRTPRACFQAPLTTPIVQFLYRQHFMRRGLRYLSGRKPGSREACFGWGHAIARPADESPRRQPSASSAPPAGRVVRDWLNLSDMHGVYRPDVRQIERPLSRTIDELLGR